MDFPDFHSYARLLNGLNTPSSVLQGKQLHLLFLKKGILFSTLSIANRLLQMYARCGTMDNAQRLFDEMPQRNSFTWNTLLEGFAKSGDKGNLLDLFHAMPDRNDFSWDVVLSGLVKGGDLGSARQLFDRMPRRNAIAWTKMIHGYARNGEPEMALRFFKDLLKWEMVETGGGSVLRLDPFVLASVVGACSDIGYVELGKQVHARMVIDSVELDSVLESSLTNMYRKCGDLDSAGCLLNTMEDPDDYSLSSLISGYASFGRMDDARRLFELKSNPCVVLWNSMIAGYVANGDPAEALMLFCNMHKGGVLGDFSTFSSILNACSDIGILQNCIQLHTISYKLGILCQLMVASAFIDAYSKCGSSNDACGLFHELKTYDTVLLNSMIMIYFKCGRIDEARRLFNDMKSKSLITWNSMIVGLSQNSFPTEALELFRVMNRNNLRMDKFTLGSAISACASISLLEFGEQIFAKAIVIGLEMDQVIATSSIDLFCKSGRVEAAQKLFNQISNADEALWNSMLMGYAMNGYGHEALALFHEMRREGILPSNITFTAVLSACNHCGLVEEGKNWFFQMKHEYNIDPGIEHYSCVIDLLARAGNLQEAIDLLNEVPYQIDPNMWSAVLRGCVETGDNALSKKVSERIMELDPQNAGALVQLAGAMASTGDWKQSETVRQLMREMRVQKSPGQSWCVL